MIKIWTDSTNFYEYIHWFIIIVELKPDLVVVKIQFFVYFGPLHFEHFVHSVHFEHFEHFQHFVHFEHF